MSRTSTNHLNRIDVPLAGMVWGMFLLKGTELDQKAYEIHKSNTKFPI